MRYREHLSLRRLDRAIYVPGCSRGVSKWITRSHECESTCIIASSGCDSVRARGVFRVNARVIHPSTSVSCRYLGGSGWTIPLAYRDIIYPHMSIYGPTIRNESVRRCGRSVVLRYQKGYRGIVSFRETEDPWSFITPFVMSRWMKYSADFRL